MFTLKRTPRIPPKLRPRLRWKQRKNQIWMSPLPTKKRLLANHQKSLEMLTLPIQLTPSTTRIGLRKIKTHTLKSHPRPLMRQSLQPNNLRIKRISKSKLLKTHIRLSSSIKWNLPLIWERLRPRTRSISLWSRPKNIIMLKLNKVLTQSQRNQIIKMNNCKTKQMPLMTLRTPIPRPQKPQLLLMQTAKSKITNNKPAQ